MAPGRPVRRLILEALALAAFLLAVFVIALNLAIYLFLIWRWRRSSREGKRGAVGTTPSRS